MSDSLEIPSLEASATFAIPDGKHRTTATSSLANFDSFRTPHKRPRMDSYTSSGSSVPSLSSFGSSAPSSASSSSALLSPLSTAFSYSGDNLSPTEASSERALDSSFFAAMQDVYLSKTAPSWDTTALSMLSSAPLSTSPTAPMPPRQYVGAHAIRRSSTTSPRPSRRAARPPPLNLTPSAPVAAPMQVIGSQEDMDRVLWEINALMAQEQESKAPVRPAPMPLQPPASMGPVPVPANFNVAGVSLDLGDLELLAAKPSPATWAPPASAPAFRTSFGPVFGDGYPATAPAIDLVDPFASLAAPHFPAYSPPPFNPYTAFSDMWTAPAPATTYVSQRRASAASIGRPRSAPIVPSIGAVRRASATSKRLARKTSFVNFSAKDANKLLSGVAPSGSSKRKRDEEAAAAAMCSQETTELGQVAKRRVVSAP
jgi:hypothetical protein